MILGDIAHSRTGDKGNNCNISIIAHNLEDYPIIAEKVTAAKVKELFKDRVHGEVLRYELPQLGALNFLLYDSMHGGVTRSLCIDPHGKNLGQYVLLMELTMS